MTHAKMLKRLLIWSCWVLSQLPVWANHIYGGNMSMQAAGKPNTYTLSLTLFFDKRNAALTAGYESPTVYLFRKKDHARVGILSLSINENEELISPTIACSALLPLSILRIRYSTTITLEPGQFNDPQGYYVI